MDIDSETARRLWEVEQIYRNRLPELHRVAAAICGSRQAAPDIVQEAFVRVVGRLDSFRGDGPLEAWVWRIVVNVARNGQRKPLVVAPSEKESANDGSWESIVLTQLAAALLKLSERQRLVVFLHYYADLDYATIADALSITSGTVGATLTAARATLGQALEMKEATP